MKCSHKREWAWVKWNLKSRRMCLQSDTWRGSSNWYSCRDWWYIYYVSGGLMYSHTEADILTVVAFLPPTVFSSSLYSFVWGVTLLILILLLPDCQQIPPHPLPLELILPGLRQFLDQLSIWTPTEVSWCLLFTFYLVLSFEFWGLAFLLQCQFGFWPMSVGASPNKLKVSAVRFPKYILDFPFPFWNLICNI